MHHQARLLLLHSQGDVLPGDDLKEMDLSHCCYRSSRELAVEEAEGASSHTANSDVCSWDVWKPPCFLLSVIHVCLVCENHFQKAKTSLYSLIFMLQHLKQSREMASCLNLEWEEEQDRAWHG